MRNFTLMSGLLLLSLIVCVFQAGSPSQISEFHTVEVQPGEEVTLLCTNFTSSPTLIIWFRVVKLLKPSCISTIYTSSRPASFCDGFQNDRFEVTSNSSTVFLKIRKVDSSDSGLYFCGYHITSNPVIVGATYLEVQVFLVGVTKMSVILGGLTVFLALVIVGLIVKIKKLQKAHVGEKNPQQAENLGSDELNYATVTFRPKKSRNSGPASESELELNAIYSATR
uniref:Ig-like domain-containing protein n=1 Tax=Lates calcarifer TaxID=8187 RepID=A0A4W6CWY2_LATCA